MATIYYSNNLSASADTFIRSTSSGTSYGSADYVACGQYPQWTQNDCGLFRFDGMVIDAAGTVEPISAVLTLTTYTTNNSISNSSGTLNIGRMTNSFTESSTYSGVSSRRAGSVDTQSFSRGSVGSTDTLNIINTYRAIVNAGVNYGFWIGSNNAGAWRVCSQEHGTSSYRPRLNCSYYIRRTYSVATANSSLVTVSGGGTTRDGDQRTLSASIVSAAGYTTSFTGWFKNNTGSAVSTSLNYTLTASSGAAGSYTARASRSANSYTVTLNRNGGSGGTASVTATYGSAMPSISTPSRTGYSFSGYYSTTSGGTKYYNTDGSSARSYTTAGTSTLYANWTANTYTITNASGSYISSTSGGGSKTYGSSVTLDCVLSSATGYTTTFNQWTSNNTSLVPNSSNQEYTFNTPAGNVTLTASANRTANTYTIHYNGNGNTGGSTANSSHTYDVAKNLTTNGFTRTGYSFAGWATSASGAVVYSNSQSVSNLSSTQGATVELYAKWTANTYTVTFDPASGTIVGNSSKNVTFASTIGTLPSATRVGYEFDGWWTTEGSGGTRIISTTVYQIAGNTTYYARWSGSGRVWTNIGTGKYKGIVNFEWSGSGWDVID